MTQPNNPALKELTQEKMEQIAPSILEKLNPDTRSLVDRFAKALAEKLAAAQEKYGFTADWLKNDWRAECTEHFHQHVEKGDPRDVAAYCAFMWHHGWSTTLPELHETGAEADLIPWNHPLQIGAEVVVKRYNDYAQGHLPSDCNRELSRLIAYFAQQQLSQLRAANGELEKEIAHLKQGAIDRNQAVQDLEEQLGLETASFEVEQTARVFADAKGRLGEAEKNAARYQWIRSEGLQHIKWEGLTTDTCDVGLDYAIDSRLAQPNPEK